VIKGGEIQRKNRRGDDSGAGVSTAASCNICLPGSGKDADPRAGRVKTPVDSQAMQRNTKSVLLGKPANRAANACHGKAEESRIVTGDESAHVYVPSAVWRYVSARYVARTGCVSCGCVGECSGRLLHERGVPSQRLDRAVAVVRRMMCMSRKLVKALGIRGQRVIVV
jgi:hypothetical protein